MAVGRRKRFYSGTLPTATATLLTAGAAPTDGSAAATVTIYLINASGTAVTNVVVSVVGVGIWFSASMAGGQAVTIGPIDLMGGEAISGSAGTVGAVGCHITGVEARDT
jgi:hypothetical protein